MKAGKLVLSLVLAAGLVAGLAVPVMAAKPEKVVKATAPLNSPPKVQYETLRGDVKSVDAAGQTFILQSETKGKGDIKITTDNTTKYYKMSLPAGFGKAMVKLADIKDALLEKFQEKFQDKDTRGNPGKGNGVSGNQTAPPINSFMPEVKFTGNATFADISAGATVSAVVEKDKTLAKQVIIQDRPFERVTGMVTAINATAKSVTIQVQNGDNVTVTCDNTTAVTLRGSLALETGQKVNVVYRASSKVALEISVIPAAAVQPTPRINVPALNSNIRPDNHAHF